MNMGEQGRDSVVLCVCWTRGSIDCTEKEGEGIMYFVCVWLRKGKRRENIV